MNPFSTDDTVASPRLAPPQPTLVWGALMSAALVAAVVTVFTSGGRRTDERLVATSGSQALGQSVARLAAERNELAGRVASLERSLGEMKLAARGGTATPETTGSIARAQMQTRPAQEPRPGGFALSLGSDINAESARRRWSVLAARYPQLLSRLSPRTVSDPRGDGSFDLVAGPLTNRGDAERLCAALAEQGLACDTTAYAGEPFGRP